MSSCFLCDCSYKFTVDDRYSVVYAEGKTEYHSMKYMPIMVGSSGLETNRQGRVFGPGTDQQHKDNNGQNYVSYRVKKIEFRASVIDSAHTYEGVVLIPDYIILFKVPFRDPVFDYYFTVMKNFVLYSEPESVLKYGVYPYLHTSVETPEGTATCYLRDRDKYNLTVNKPFVVGPNDYVGVLYFFGYGSRIDASARVWFDVV